MALVLETVWANGGTESGGVTVTKPTGTVENDGMIAFGELDQTTVFNDLDGFTSIVQGTQNTNRQFCFYKLAGASEGTTYTFTRTEGTEGFAAGTIRFSGVDTSDFIGAVSTISQGASAATSCVAPAITAESADSIILRIFTFTTFSSSESDGVSVATGTERINEVGVGAEGVFVSSEASPGASTTTGTRSLTYSVGDSEWAAWTLEILPAAAGTIIPHAMNHYRQRRN